MTSEQTYKERKPIVEGLFTWPSDDPRLIASRCKSCNSHFFPRSDVCQNPSCMNLVDMEEVTLSTRGKIWTYTYAYFPPPPPFKSRQPFTPYGVGVIELAEGIKVLSMLTDCAQEDLKVGLDVELVVESQYEDEAGNEYLTWKFRPVGVRR